MNIRKWTLVSLLALALAIVALPGLAQEAPGEAGVAAVPAAGYPVTGGCPGCGLAPEAEVPLGEMPAEEEDFDWEAWIEQETEQAAQSETLEFRPADGRADDDPEAVFCPACGRRLDGLYTGEAPLDDDGPLYADGYQGGWDSFPDGGEYPDEEAGYLDEVGYPDGGDGFLYGEEYLNEEGFPDGGCPGCLLAEGGETPDALAGEAAGPALSLAQQERLIRAYTLLDELREALKNDPAPRAEALGRLAAEISALIEALEFGAQYE